MFSDNRSGYINIDMQRDLDTSLTADELQSIPKADANRLALALGYYAKKKALVAIAGLVCVVVALLGLANGAASDSVPPAVVSWAAVLGGVLAAFFLWLVSNAPFDMLKKLQETIRATMQTNKAARREVDRLTTQVTSLTAENQTYESQNQRHAQLNDTLSSQLAMFKAMCQGQQKSLTDLAATLTDDTTRLGQVMKQMQSELAVGVDQLAASTSAFYSTLTGLDEATRQNQLLTKQLAHTAQQMEELLEEARDEAFNDKLETVVAELDELSDGENGLRAKLQTATTAGEVTLVATTAQALLRLLQLIDIMLQEKLAKDVAHMNHQRHVVTIAQARELI